MTTGLDRHIRSPLRHLDPTAVGAAVHREVRSRQHHLPPVSVYRWWARRTESVMSAVIRATELDLEGRLTIADPFAGGGVIALSALLSGHQLYAQDINPWAATNLANMLDLPDAADIRNAGERLHRLIEPLLKRAYASEISDGTAGELVHTLRVATAACVGCQRRLRLFPTATVSLLKRVDCGGTKGYLACACGHLQLGDLVEHQTCSACDRTIDPLEHYTQGRWIECSDCGWRGKLHALVLAAPLDWEVVLVERTATGHREIAPPTPKEIANARCASWTPNCMLDAIGYGVETSSLRRHGFLNWADLYPARQRVVLEALLDHCSVAAGGDERVERALRAAVLGAVEMAGFASRWDARYLKAYETISNHRFTMTTLSAEPNVWGAAASGRGTITRRIDLIARAAAWLREQVGGRLVLEGPLLPSSRRTRMALSTDARVVEGSSERLVLQENSLDLVLTDPPYHDDVQYGELSDIFRTWAGMTTGTLVGDAIVTRSSKTATTDTYRELLTKVFTEARRALRPRGHLILSYANRTPKAWISLFQALQAAGFQAVGYEVVRSDNEDDRAKAGKRACTLDVLLDLVSKDIDAVQQHRPVAIIESDEGQFCRLVGEQALRIGLLASDWHVRFETELSGSPFLSALDSIAISA